MKYNLSYGKTGHIIELPDRYQIDLIEPKQTECVDDQYKSIIDSLEKPYNCRPLKEIAESRNKIGIIFSDITRATPYHIIIPALLDELGHIPRENIIFFCANGTHRLVTEGELVKILGKDIVKNYRIVQNEANDPDLHEYVGTTSSGNKIFLNQEVLKCTIKILTGFIEPHLFAGFSGGGKALIPGMSFLDTIKFNHSISHLSHKETVWGVTDGNLLWEEIMEAAEFVPGLFLLNISLNKNKDITSVFAGDLRAAHKAGCRFVKESAMVPVNKLYDIVITSNSGYPLDLNIYQSVKGMSTAAQIIKPGGHIIIAAECWDGIPQGSDYEAILSAANSPEALMKYIMSKEAILKDTWQVYCQALVQRRANVYLYSDKLDKKTIKKALLNPVDNISTLTDELVRKTNSKASICIMPEGPQTIPYLEKE